MPDEMRISAIIPAFNGANYLSETIRSVLCQTRAPYEIIIIDDGSTDDTPSVAASFGNAIRYDRQPHRGLSATLNRGVQLARGNLFAFLDSDDVWVPDKLQKQVAVLQANPEMDMVFGYSRCFASPDLDADAARRLAIPDEPQSGALKSAMLIRRNSFFKVGLFDANLRVGDFVDWYSRASDAGLKAHFLKEVLFNRRIHGHNMTLVDRSSQGDYVRIVKAALDRRRAGGCLPSRSDSDHEPSR